jgi:hypothetical protein
MPELTPDETVRDLFARYERDGIDAAFDLLDDDVVLMLGPGPGRVLRGTTSTSPRAWTQSSGAARRRWRAARCAARGRGPSTSPSATASSTSSTAACAG